MAVEKAKLETLNLFFTASIMATVMKSSLCLQSLKPRKVTKKMFFLKINFIIWLSEIRAL